MAFKYASIPQRPVAIKRARSQNCVSADTMESPPPFNAASPGWVTVFGFPVVSAVCGTNN